MTKRKKQSRRGRPPSGEFPGKSSTFTTRIQPETRRALDEAARKNGRTVSVMAEYILRQWLKKPAGDPRNVALAAAVALLAENIERDAKKSWRDDPWVGFALANGVENLVRYFAPAPVSEDMPPAPAAVEEAAAKWSSDEIAQQFRKPHAYGRIQAQFLIREIEQAASPGPISEMSMPIFFNERPAKLALIGRELTDSRKGKSK
jgi:hypothetical protein